MGLCNSKPGMNESTNQPKKLGNTFSGPSSQQHYQKGVPNHNFNNSPPQFQYLKETKSMDQDISRYLKSSDVSINTSSIDLAPKDLGLIAKKIVSIATSTQVSSYLLINKDTPSDSFVLQLDKSDEDQFTISKIEQLVLTKLPSKIKAIEVKETYFTGSIDREKRISYYVDSQPLYFRTFELLELQCESRLTENVSFLKIQVYANDSCAELYKKIERALGTEECVIALELESDKQRGIGRTSRRLDSLIKDFGNVKVLVKPGSRSEMTIIVQKVSGEPERFSCFPDETLGQLKNKICERLDIPPHNQRLVFAGKELNDDYTFNDYQIQNESIIHLVLKLGGEGQLFGDISNTSGAIKLQRSNTAPDWREVTLGLNLEGECTNRSCQAYGKSNVIIKMGYTIFDLMLDKEMCKCPMCFQFVELITCALSKCEYTYSGLKKTVGGRPIRYAKQEWTSVGDEYLLYDPRETGVEWTNLKIYTRLKSSDSGVAKKQVVCDGVQCRYEEVTMVMCAICKKSVDQRLKSNCGHVYHDDCLTKMLDIVPSKCYLCLF